MVLVSNLKCDTHQHQWTAEQLQHYVNSLGLPVLGFIRDTQNYVQLAARGATIWDAAYSRVERDLEQWGELIQWVEK